MSTARELRLLAARQHGLVSTVQARSLGLTPDQVQRWPRSDAWETASLRVLRVVGAPSTDHQRAMLAVLDAGPGAVLSHQGAAALWGLPGFDLRTLHVTRPEGGGQVRRPVARVHRVRCIPPGHVSTFDGIPLTTPTRTLFDLAGVLHPGRTERALDNAWSLRLTSGPLLHAHLAELGLSGRKGISVMRALLADRGPDYVAPESGLERRYHELIAEDGQPPLQRQVHVGGEQLLGRMDAADLAAAVVVQIDSTRFHGSLLDRERDHAQTEALRRAGYAVLRFTGDDVWYRPRYVQKRTREARAAGRRARDREPAPRPVGPT